MRYRASEEREIIRLLEQSRLGVNHPLAKIGVSRATQGRWGWNALRSNCARWHDLLFAILNGPRTVRPIRCESFVQLNQPLVFGQFTLWCARLNDGMTSKLMRGLPSGFVQTL